jgi:hypothetical protein
MEKSIVILDCGVDMEEIAGPLGCCGAAVISIRA